MDFAIKKINIRNPANTLPWFANFSNVLREIVVTTVSIQIKQSSAKQPSLNFAIRISLQKHKWDLVYLIYVQGRGGERIKETHC